MGLCEVFMEFVLRFLWGLMGFYEVDGVFFWARSTKYSPENP
jgi:hypothetical protein